MKVIVNEKPKSEQREYPYIGIDGDCIILFYSMKMGIVLNSKIYSIGEYSDKWNESVFEPFNGEIMLINS